MSENSARITYWSQETEESERWISTGPMYREDAKIMLERYPYFFPRGYIDEGARLDEREKQEKFLGSACVLLMYFAGAILLFNCVLLLINFVNL